jgi:hypothetical protein
VDTPPDTTITDAVHSHAGPNGVISRTAAPSDELARAIRTGGLAAICLADVPDGPLLGRNVDALLQKGFTTAEAGNLAGENFGRIFAQSAAV